MINILHKCYVILVIELDWVKFVLTSLKSLLNWLALLAASHSSKTYTPFFVLFLQLCCCQVSLTNIPTTLIVHNSSHCVNSSLFCSAIFVLYLCKLKFPWTCRIVIYACARSCMNCLMIGQQKSELKLLSWSKVGFHYSNLRCTYAGLS